MIPHKYCRLWRRVDASYIAFNRRNKYGLLDSCGNELIPFEYDYLGGEIPDRISARQGEDQFVLDGAGQRLSEKRYDYLGDFTENGYAIFGEKESDFKPESMRYGIIDRYEKITVQAIYSSLCEILAISIDYLVKHPITPDSALSIVTATLLFL